MPTSHLARNPNDAWIAGVCGGIARWLGWNSDAVRILYVILTVASLGLLGIVAYIVLWAVMPIEGDDRQP
jgi:phage shock protein PspC (stress-responsive transcriptional regulator)